MILVTGGTGLVGAHLLLELCKGSTPIKATYRNPEKITLVEKIFSYQTNNPKALLERITWVKADVLDIPSLEEAFVGIRKVYHAAALVSFDPKQDKELMATNFTGTTNIVNLCIKNNVEKLCFISSIASLGRSINGAMVTEQTDWSRATTAYGLSKHFAEMEIWRASQEGVKINIINPGIVIAPGFWKSSSGNFFRHAAKGSKYYLPSGTGFVGVNDVVNSLLLLMEKDIYNEQYILVNKNWTYKKFASLLAQGLNKPIPKKEIPNWSMAIFWRWDWLRSHLFGKRRRLSRAVFKLFSVMENYDNTKVREDLNFEFEDLESRIKEYCLIYLNEN